MAVKMQVLKRLEAGERQSDIGRSLGLVTSTLRTIMKNADKIKITAQCTTSVTATRVTRTRSSLLENMESQLSIWVEDQNQRHMPLSQLIIMEKARSLFTTIQQQEGDGSSTETFTANRGWFEKFKHRSNIHSIRITGEAASSNMQAAQEFPDMLKQIIHQGNYPPQLVFNVGETALFWKRMPSRTFISREEKHASGFKCAKDRLTLLLGGNASGDFKLKPMLVYHSENPRALKGLSKDHLSYGGRTRRPR